MMLGIEVHQTRQYYFSQSEGPLGDFLLNLSVFSLMHCDDVMGLCQKSAENVRQLGKFASSCENCRVCLNLR